MSQIKKRQKKKYGNSLAWDIWWVYQTHLQRATPLCMRRLPKVSKKFRENRTVSENSEMRLEEIMTNVLTSNYLLSAESLNFPPCLYSRLSSQLCGSDTRERAPSRRVTSRHVTREATQAEREKEKGGATKKRKSPQKNTNNMNLCRRVGRRHRRQTCSARR